ncbi:MBL fold metallo-hydrolase [Oscillibacter sp.]|uniref:ComEC/Rec2 family competence protein n=1 Tax=Oscillibacter sp. TaxID=1945593 RepID=UPI00262E3B5D|nr:MBL fold metallo-hydrolase [Oscillibacter sp.]MDD3346662.1 MBL fold metallo-hydrolase [Oscillibacter sp.]
MLTLDFINVGNGDSILVRELRGGQQRFAMLVDCGHDCLVRDDHPAPPDPRSKRIYAGEFLRRHGVTHLDVLLVTHFHRDHIGGLGRVLEAVTVDRLLTTYAPPPDAGALHPDEARDLPKAARNLLRCVDLYAAALRTHPGQVGETVVLPGKRLEHLALTEELSMDLLFGEPALYPRQKQLYDEAFSGVRDPYDLIHWGKSMNVSSLRERLFYHGKEIVLGGDAYAHMWETETATPCDILKVPHHASLSSTTRKLLHLLQPKIAVVCVAAGRPDERPHPYIISLLREFAQEVYFTDAVDLPGLVEPAFHESVHLEIE